ncbi:MAG: dUTP diphosphatase [Ruminococcaceae bacterium]|nr:dUTP diphosphatase [Oscillospiraceae bacterium]
MNQEKVKVAIEICREGVSLPFYAKPGDAGMDVRAAIDITLAPGETKIIPTGLKVAIPVGYEIQVRPRSGMSFKTPIRVANAPGTIDAGYRDEVGIILTNTSATESFAIAKDDRVAQFVLQKVPMMEFEVVDDVSAIGENRGGGFGHTGNN